MEFKELFYLTFACLFLVAALLDSLDTNQSAK